MALNIRKLVDLTESYVDSDGTIKSSAVDTDAIKDGEVSTSDLKAANVTTAKIADSNVTTAKIADEAVTEAKLASEASDGLYAHRIARATLDATSGLTKDQTVASGVTLPDNAVVTRAWYEVITTFTSSSDAEEIAINIPTDGDLQATVAISAGTNPYDSGFHECDTKGGDGLVGNYIKTTDAREISFVLSDDEDLTDGKLILFVEYVVTE